MRFEKQRDRQYRQKMHIRQCTPQYGISALFSMPYLVNLETLYLKQGTEYHVYTETVKRSQPVPVCQVG